MFVVHGSCVGGGTAIVSKDINWTEGVGAEARVPDARGASASSLQGPTGSVWARDVTHRKSELCFPLTAGITFQLQREGCRVSPARSAFRCGACGVALVGPSWCPVAPGCCPGVSPVFRGCFSVTSEADVGIRLQGHRPKNRTSRYSLQAVKPNGELYMADVLQCRSCAS